VSTVGNTYKDPLNGLAVHEEVLECCRALRITPLYLCDYHLMVLMGWFMPSIEGLERIFRPGARESLKDAIIRQRGKKAFAALEKFVEWSKTNGIGKRNDGKTGVRENG